MKKIILFLAILSVGLISSCSKDDDSNNDTPGPTPDDVFTAKINGVQKNFTVTNVDIQEYPGWTTMEISAQIGNDNSNTFELNLARDNGEVYWAQYLDTGNYFNTGEDQEPPVSITADISENSDDLYKGTFSGTLSSNGNTAETLTVTDGIFEIHF